MDANDHNAREVQEFIGSIPFKLRRELVTVIREEADLLKAAIKAAARKGKTGNLAESVQVRRGRHTLELVVTAGGLLTTKTVRVGSGVEYDYALGEEWGNSHYSGKPFFFSTWRARRQETEDRIQAKFDDILERAFG